MIRAALLVLGVAAAFPALAQETPARAIADYANYELRDIQARAEVHPKVMDKLTSELKLRIDPALARWNAEGSKPGRAGTLAIEVVIRRMKFVSGGKRLWAGSFAGGSYSEAEVRLVDAGSGQLIDSQSFEHQARAVSGAWSFGASDNAMLDRLAESAAKWVIARHDGTPVPSEEAEEPAKN